MNLQVLQDLKEGCKQSGYRPGFSISTIVFHYFSSFSFGFSIIKPEEQILETCECTDSFINFSLAYQRLFHYYGL